MELIYDDLILEIGRYLPIKALCAFICTSSKVLVVAGTLVINSIKAMFWTNTDRIKTLLIEHKSLLKVYRHIYECYHMMFHPWCERTIKITDEPPKQIHILMPYWDHSSPMQQMIGRVNRTPKHIPKPKSVQRLTEKVQQKRQYVPKTRVASRNQLRRINLRR